MKCAGKPIPLCWFQGDLQRACLSRSVSGHDFSGAGTGYWFQSREGSGLMETLKVRLPHSRKETFMAACKEEGISVSDAMATGLRYRLVRI